jgi:Uma2 family endonuclease
MAIELERPTLTREEFRALQDPIGSDIRGYEYEDGKLIPVPPVHGPQSSAWGDLFARVNSFVGQHGLGRVWIDLAVYLDPDGRRRVFPDIVYLASDELHRYDGDIITGPPTLVVEVTAVSSQVRDREAKMRVYHEARVPWYWIADVVTRQIDENRWRQEGYELASRTPFEGEFHPQLFPGLVISGVL